MMLCRRMSEKKRQQKLTTSNVIGLKRCSIRVTAVVHYGCLRMPTLFKMHFYTATVSAIDCWRGASCRIMCM